MNPSTNITSEGKPTHCALIFLLLAALLLRLLFLLYFGAITTPDTIGYTSLAEGLVQGKFYTQVNNIFRLPGYPLFAGVIYTATGSSNTALILAQILLSSTTALLAYAIASEVFDRRTGVWTGWLVALNPALAYYTTVLLAETLMIFLSALVTWAFIRAVKSGNNRWLVLAGLALAYLVGTKSIFILLVPVFLLMTFFAGKLKQIWLGLVFMTLAVAGVYLGWTEINARRFGYAEFSPSYGLNLLERTIYLDAPHNQSIIKNSALHEYEQLKSQDALGAQSDALYYSLAVINTWMQYGKSEVVPEMNRKFFSVALKQIKGDPLGYLKTTGGELAYTWAGYTPHWAKWRPTQLGEIPDWSFLILGPVLGAMMVLLVLYGSIRSIFKLNWLAMSLILSVALITLASAMIIPSDYRYRLVVEPQVLSIISFALVGILDRNYLPWK